MILKEQNGHKVYSDGETVEEKMLEIAKQYPEDLSQDYISGSSEYTINNTFSLVRQNVLNWYPFRDDAEILEIGAGMGSLTGLLCDRAAFVTSVEMNSDRADVIRARYPERKNLEVICGDIVNWKTEKKFDYVIFIGVLEYASVFMDGSNPAEEFLKIAGNFLKEDGVLLFAIENRFGLKYWVGGSEDHLQKPFAGLEGYKDAGSPRTFSKYELSQMLDHVGLEKQRFYYLFPDYKFPEVICTDDFRPSYANLQKVSFTYSRNSLFTVDEKELYKDIVENDVWRFFANSYLVEAGRAALDQNPVIHVSSKGESKKEFKVSTIIRKDGNVYKVPMHREASGHICSILENTAYLQKRGIKVLNVKQAGDGLVSELHKGKSAQDYFCELLEANDRKRLFEFLEHYREILLKTSELSFDHCICQEMGLKDEEVHVGPILQKGFIDLTFYNAFYDSGELVFYDQEWCFDNIPLNFILYYSIKTSYRRAYVDTLIQIEEIWDYFGLNNSEMLFDRMEDYLWSKVLYRQTDFYGEDGYCNRYSKEETIGTLKGNLMQMQDALMQMQNDLVRSQRSEEKLLEERNAFARQNNSLAKENEELSQSLRSISRRATDLEAETVRKEDVISQLNQEVLNKEGHIQLLLPAEREYNKIIASRMFKVMRAVCASYDTVMIVPRWLIRNGTAFARMLSHVNIPKLKIAGGYVKREGIKGAYAHLMRDYHQGELRQIQVKVEESVVTESSIEMYDEIEFPVTENPVVSIVIPAYNQFGYTYQCLKSIRENSGEVSYEVILADDCSTDITKEIQKAVKNILVVRTETNLLFLRNCNNAAAYARGKYILFLNNDTQVQEGWLEPLVNLCERDDTIGMTGSKLVYSDGTLQEAGGIIWKDGSGWNYGRNDDAMKPEYNYVREVDYISGAAIMIRADLWKEIGGFDEYFAPAYCEDSDLAFQVREKGYRVVYQPLSVVVHFEGKSNGTDLNSGTKHYQIENSRKLREKWKKELACQYPNGQDIFRARERAKNKKVILVIDHYVPQYDKDAGSKTTFQYLRMFVKQGYIVKFIGDNFYQHEPYTTMLQQMGIEVLYGPWYAEHWKEWIKDNCRNIDFAYLNRPHITIKYIDFLKDETNIKCIYYGHDLHFLRLKREFDLTGDDKKLSESQEWMEKELYIMRRTDMNYYPSCIEEQEIHKIDAEIPVKAITAYVYETFRNKNGLEFSKREGIVFVGGFGHPPNEDAVLWFAKEVYPLILKEKRIPFYIVGSNPTDAVQRLADENIMVKGFVSEEELQELYDTCKLVVVPLRYGAGVKGKVVEALYYGTPMVTTSVGIEGIEGAEKIISTADDANAFAQTVLRLYDNDAELAGISGGYQSFVKKKFSMEAVWDVIKEDFQ